MPDHLAKVMKLQIDEKGPAGLMTSIKNVFLQESII